MPWSLSESDRDRDTRAGALCQSRWFKFTVVTRFVQVPGVDGGTFRVASGVIERGGRLCYAHTTMRGYSRAERIGVQLPRGLSECEGPQMIQAMSPQSRRCVMHTYMYSTGCCIYGTPPPSSLLSCKGAYAEQSHSSYIWLRSWRSVGGWTQTHCL